MTVAVERDKWGSKVDFILSCLGYAVGLGNVWRFPYLCGRSGGAAFLIPYFIMMLIAGFPLFYLELAIGQYSAMTPHLLYRRICRIFTGIGYAMVTISTLTGIYYNMIIAWALFYFGVSFTSNLPWAGCYNPWNTFHCKDDILLDKCQPFPAKTYYLGECYNGTDPIFADASRANFVNETILKKINSTFYNPPVVLKENATNTTNATYEVKKIATTTPAEEYLIRRVLKRSSGIDVLGTPSWELVVVYAVSWVLVFVCLIRGIKSSGKVVYFTATFPYVILIILLIRGVTLEGAGDGIEFYLVPNFTKLSEAQVWGDAAGQIFFSLSLAWGGLSTLASYNEFHNNILRDTFIVVLGNCGTSLFAGFVVFSILGFVAKKTDKLVKDVAKSGSTLAFVAYPDAILRMPGAPFWAVLFFFMLILLGIDSQLVIVEVLITCILDQWPSLRHWKKKMFVVAGVCTVSFVIGILLTCPGGPWILDLVDTFVGGWPLVLAGLAEVIMIGLCYGSKRLIGDIRMMIGIPTGNCLRTTVAILNVYWVSCWTVLTPLLLIFVLLFNWVAYKGLTSGDYEYPSWAEGVGWLLSILAISWIPIFAAVFTFIAFSRNKGARWLITPSRLWRPHDGTAEPKEPANQYGMEPVPGAYGNPGFTSDGSQRPAKESSQELYKF